MKKAFIYYGSHGCRYTKAFKSSHAWFFEIDQETSLPIGSNVYIDYWSDNGIHFKVKEIEHFNEESGSATLFQLKILDMESDLTQMEPTDFVEYITKNWIPFKKEEFLEWLKK